MRLAFHSQSRHLKVRADGVRSCGFGLQVGYWPCLKAPYVSLVFLFHRHDLWFGLPVACDTKSTKTLDT
jgi:hypothetical protein